MLKLSLAKELLVEPLSALNSIAQTKQTLAILSNVLINVRSNKIKFTSTDLELELTIEIDYESQFESDFTIPCRKLFDIIRNLPDGSMVNFSFKDGKVIITSGKSRFVLSTLPAENFPNLDPIESASEFTVKSIDLKLSIENTEFCMATKDVRYYLNGLLLEISEDTLKTVATDGHRLAFYESEQIYNLNEIPENSKLQFLIPRKTILELLKILDDSEKEVKIKVTPNFVKFSIGKTEFSTKLIDSKFPEYRRVIPKVTNLSIPINRLELKESLTRAAVLSTEKFKAIRLEFSKNNLLATIHNPEHEEAEEEMVIAYEGENFSIGFNVNYLVDVLSRVKDEQIIFNFTESYNSCLLYGNSKENPVYVVMPMRL